MYKIEKGVEIPTLANGRKKRVVDYPFSEMEVDDSFFIRCKKEDVQRFQARVFNHLHVFKTESGRNTFKISTRRIDDGVRVWRIK